MKLIYSTEKVHLRDKFRLWTEALNDRIVPAKQTRLDDGPYEAILQSATFGPFVISVLSQGALRTELTADLIRGRDRGSISVGIRLAGIGTASQDGRESVQGPGEMAVLAHRPAVLSSSRESRTILLELSRDRLEKLIGPSALYTSLTIGSDLASTNLVIGYFKGIIDGLDRFPPDTMARMAAIGEALLVSSISDRLAKDPPRSIQGTVLVQRAKAYIVSNYCDPSLDPPQVAAAIGISLRRLQELFHERGRQVSDVIWELRLNTAAARLSDPRFDHLPLGSLAYGCGFVSQPHFSRRFKSKYDLTPSEYRRKSASA